MSPGRSCSRILKRNEEQPDCSVTSPQNCPTKRGCLTIGMKSARLLAKALNIDPRRLLAVEARQDHTTMNRSDALHLIYLVLLLAVIIAMRWRPGLRRRKFDWRLFKGKTRRKD